MEKNSSKPDILVEHGRTKNTQHVLLSRGVDYTNLLRTNAHFDLGDALVKVEPDIKNIIRRPLTIKKQYEAAQSILNHPLKGRYVLGISSFPSDLRAKQLAVMVMRNTIMYINRKKIKKDYPLWHKVYGNYKDDLRDGKEDLPISMLILSNITPDSTSIKLEKVRDLLERYSHIPRIVVLGGQDPITFFANRLYFPLTAGLYLGADNRIQDI